MAEKRTKVEIKAFIAAWESSNSVKEVAEKTGIKLTSVMARASKYRGAPYNIPLKNMPRGGGAKLDVAEVKNYLATLRNVTGEVIEAESAQLVAKRATETPAS